MMGYLTLIILALAAVNGLLVAILTVRIAPKPRIPQPLDEILEPFHHYD